MTAQQTDRILQTQHQPLEPQALEDARKAYSRGDPAPMEALLREALDRDAGHPKAAAMLCALLSAQGRYQEAEGMMSVAVGHNPGNGSLLINLAHCQLRMGRHEAALQSARRSTQLLPDTHKSWVNLSSACFHAEAYEEGVTAARKALGFRPDDAVAYNNLGSLLKSQGDIKASIEAFRCAVEHAPEQASYHTNLLLALLYDEHVTIPEVVAVAKSYADQFEDSVRAQRLHHLNVALPERRLKIGFLSPDFASHAVMYFAESVISRLPRHQFEVYAYYLRSSGDGVTQRVRSIADVFRQVPEPDAKAAATIIHQDQIDVLIDLAGHTASTGLPAMAYKPAPVQVTWLGYPGTTGLTTIDWRITDHTADPPGSDAHYTEKLIRLPGCFAVYRSYIRGSAQRFDPRYEVGPTPALSKGYVTFGSCNNIAKIGEAAVAAWSRVLHRVPGSRMLIEGKDLGREAAQVKLRGMFEAQGIEGSRLEFVQRDSARQYLTYHDIDVALDTFPLTGGTTTFDTLWMGVPVVSLEGKTYRERISTTILVNGGFGEYLCRSVDEYVDRAVEMVRDVDALQARRAGQRARMQASVLMDEARFAELFGQALRMIWRRWCKQQEPQGIAAGAPPNPGQDVLVAVEGRRVTLPSALAWLKRLTDRVAADGDEVHRKSAGILASAIMTVDPNNAAALAALKAAKADPASSPVQPTPIST